ncbi:MAG: rRNA maturation RNase YbeY [Ghiorsea sp.]
MTNMIDLLVDDDVTMLADEKSIEEAIKTSCFVARSIEKPSLCLRFANNSVVQQLNVEWREQDKVTDVLSFPMQEANAINADESLGDIIIAAPFVSEEAARLELAVAPHTLHLVVHSTLHLLGYDHIDDTEALAMQQLEQQIMHQLGLHIPYPGLPFEPAS